MSGTTFSASAPVTEPFETKNTDSNAAVEKIDDFFVFPEDHRPDTTHDNFDIDLPVIDLSPVLKLEKLRRTSDVKSLHEEINTCEIAKAAVEKEIRAACEEYGFFQVVNHGFPMAIVDQLTDSCRQLFDLPLEVKMKAEPKPLAREELLKTAGGYDPIRRSTPFTKVKDAHIWNEGFHLESPALKTTGRLEDVASLLWPEPENNESRLQLISSFSEYGKQASDLSMLLLRLMTSSLGLKEEALEDLLGQSLEKHVCGQLRVNHYPVCTQPELTWGLHGHTDPSIITVLHQDAVGGLQICFKDGTWHGVRPVAGAFVVNVADLLQAWTNGRFISAEHRALTNSKSRRFSIAYFVSPSEFETLISPRPELVDSEHPLLYQPFTRKDYFRALVTKGLSKDRSHILEKCFGKEAKEESTEHTQS